VRRCECADVKDVRPSESAPGVTVCTSCGGWFAMRIDSIEQLEALRVELAPYSASGDRGP
jgi:hypothetical protein